MKKILLLTLLALTGAAFAGCKGATDSHVTEDDTVIQRNVDENHDGNSGETPEENGGETDRLPHRPHRLPDGRHDGNAPIPKPMPGPHHKK